MGNRKYKAEYAPIAERMAFRGDTMEMIAEALGVKRSTLYRWRDAHPKMREALSAREDAVDAVERSLYETAKAGNFQAQSFVLRNRRNRHWTDRTELEVSGEVSVFKMKRMKSVPVGDQADL